MDGNMASSFLGLEGLHVFVTGAGGGIGSEVVREFMGHGCLVTAHDVKSIDKTTILASIGKSDSPNLFLLHGDITDESSISTSFKSATTHFNGHPPQILIANAGVADESRQPPLWDLSYESISHITQTNTIGTLLSIKHFLANVKSYQAKDGTELENLAIVVTGSECGKFGQAGHADYAQGKAGLQYGLVRTVKNEIVKLNRLGRINAVAPGWVNTSLIGDRLEDPREMWAEAEATVPLHKIAQPSDVARAMAFLASHRVAGHITGECLSIDGGMEGRLIWREHTSSSAPLPVSKASVPPTLFTPRPRRRLRICLTVDFDAVSGYLGTGHTPQNTISDYSAGLFSARVGVPRLVRLLTKYSIADRCTWFIPGHSLESFPVATQKIVASGAEIACHGYSHEGAHAMTPLQERDVLMRCVEAITAATGGICPVGYRAPLYQIRESTLELLKEYSFSYDSTLNATDSVPYFLPAEIPSPPPIPDYEKPASTWMQPLPASWHAGSASGGLVEIPGSWYTEDMTPLGFYPYTANSHGYVSVDAVEKMWMDRLDWVWENECEVDTEEGKDISGGFGGVFPLIWHPESAGRAHVVGMVERVVKRLVALTEKEEGVTIEKMSDVAKEWRQHHKTEA